MSDRKPRAEIEAQLEQLLTTYGQFLRGSLRQMMPRSLNIPIEELEQDVRIRLWRALSSETQIASPASYLYRIAATATLDAVRRAKTRRHELTQSEVLQVSDDGDEQATDRRHVAISTDDPAAALDRSRLRDQIERARATLAPARGVAVGLHIQGCNAGEIAKVLGWTEPKARNLLYRGLNDLRTALVKEGVELEAIQE